VSLLLLQAKAKQSRNQARLFEFGFDVMEIFHEQSSLPIAARAYMFMISDHYMSYDRFSRPYKLYELPKVDDPQTQFSSHGYYEMTGFWPEQVDMISAELTLLPDVIKCRSTGCVASRHLAIFVLLRRWHKPGNWESVSRDLRQQRGWCMQIYHETFKLVASSYRKCVRVLDYRRILPKLEEWGQKMSMHCGCDDSVIFFTDGKPWKMSRPGRGRTVRDICAAAGCGDINLMQRAYYNGHYKYHGGKVQHVLQADGIAHSFTCPIRNHDALVLRTSSMITMLSAVYIGGNLDRPAITVTDKAYGRSNHFKPIHTETELRMMTRDERELALEFDKKHKKPRMAVEYSFNQQITKFPHSDDYRRHKITQSGRSNWQYLRCLWDMQTFFFNLYTCTAGSQVTGTLGVAPPTIHEYLYSCHHNLLVDIPADDDVEEEFNVNNDFYID
jgi:hypothetical protein